MIAKRLVVVGASAGGIDALRTLVSALPETFSAAIAIALHMSPDSPGVVQEILDRASPFPVLLAYDGQRLESGRAYFAPPDRHLLVEPGRLRVTKGPRENRFRPAIDPLFRSAAQVFGPAAIGVILTGNLDDGVNGLLTVKRLGGIAVVQEPADASFPSMPANALKQLDADYVVPIARIPSLLVELTSQDVPGPSMVSIPKHVEIEVKIAKEENPRDGGLAELGKPSPYACPDCHGVLLQLSDGGRTRFRCHIGHAYSVETLLAAMNESSEEAMSTAMRSLEEHSLLMKDIAAQLGEQDRDASRRMMESSERAKRWAEAVRELILERDAVPTIDE